jgi:hypothetical protein
MVVVLSALLFAPVAGYSYSPMFMWSGSNYFTDHNVYVNEAVPSTSLGALIGNFGSRTSELPEFEEYLTAEVSSPKVVLLALYNQMTTEQLSGLAQSGGLQSLQSAMKDSASSLVVPFIYSNSTIGGALTQSVQQTLGQIQTVSGDQIVSASWLKQLVAQPSTSVLQVKMDGAQQGMLSKATTLLNEATGGKYVVVLSSNAPPAADTHAHSGASSRRLLSTSDPTFNRGPTMCSNNYEHYDVATNKCFRYVYITPAIVWGIFMAIFGFTTLYIALMCMHGVETPDVWMSKDDPGPAKGKEF